MVGTYQLNLKDIFMSKVKKDIFMLQGPSLKVVLQIEAMAEGLLTFIVSFIVLFIFLGGPRNPMVKMWLLAMSTVALVVAGSGDTGSSMNLANMSSLTLFYDLKLK